MKILPTLTFVILAFASCEQEDKRDFQVAIDNTLFQIGKPLAEVTDSRLDEVSGMVVSRKNPSHLWVHNDSGDDPKLYLIDLEAQIKMTVILEGVEAIDWEDLTWRNHNGKSQLIIGDIGDNKALRDNISLHIIDEPLFQGQDKLSIPNAEITTVNLRYQEGPRDAESLAYDPTSDRVIIITKREENVMVYEFKLEGQDELVLSSSGKINWRNFTSADINSDGQVLVKNYNVVFYWPTGSKSVAESILQEDPARVPYIIEPQGEAIAWDSLGGFYTLSEHNMNTKQLLYYYAPMQKD
ncbi:MAG: hypothetical protein RIF33_12005 [Cyclobacteriaceae bacterium]